MTADPSTSRRILIVDDSADFRVLTRQLLEAAGYRTRELPSAENLERAIDEFAPDLILCDLIMPGRDGLTVCHDLKNEISTASIPIVLASAKDFAGDKRRALEVGAAGYLVKPFTADALLKAVSDALVTQCTVRVWGCRGSVAAPEKALGQYGGNTACVEVMLPGRQHLIFDAGTGIRMLGNEMVGGSPLRTAIFLTHFHWDHVQGLPFFKPLYAPGNEISIYGPAPGNEALVEIIEGQMGGAFFPISIEAFRCATKYFALQEQTLEAFGVKISTLHVLHPGTTLAYRVEICGRALVYAPDNELLLECLEPELSGEALRFAEFARGAGLLIHDCQYSRAAYEQKRGWGHSCAEALARVAAHAEVARVLLFHHDPDHEDDAVQQIHEEFATHIARAGSSVESEPAREGASYSV